MNQATPSPIVFPDIRDTAESQDYRPEPVSGRVRADGKFLFLENEKCFISGVTYGPFRPNSSGEFYGTRAQVRSDFSLMCQCGINAIRTYTVPPRWLLDDAGSYGIRVLVGFSWEQHIAFLDERGVARDIHRRVGNYARSLTGHQALLGYLIGNEIPSPVVRWHGHRAIEKFLVGLYDTVKEKDEGVLVSYANYPTTEFLSLPFLDVSCFNVFLERQDDFHRYLDRLQNLADERPLIVSEFGLDSRAHGPDEQAAAVNWQLEEARAAGCAGVFLFSWTDEWYRGGDDVEDWDFGLVDHDRNPKPAFWNAKKRFRNNPVPVEVKPKISVIVCTFNGASTLHTTLTHLANLDYPDYEVLVVDDGSTDDTASIAKEFSVRLLRHDGNKGLSSARNTGLFAATGQIVAYIDDDAYPDAEWLAFLALTFEREECAAVGGPNLVPSGDGAIAQCVAESPGGPTHVLLTDKEAEHIPGCNMAFRTKILRDIGGFDPTFRTAGDDVDICWRLNELDMKACFCPTAVVWHHRRDTVRGYVKQQIGYGEAEAALEKKWPRKYNSLGYLTWSGKIYGHGSAENGPFAMSRIYHGQWGTAPFQRLYVREPTSLLSLLTLPEWYLWIAVLLAVTVFTNVPWIRVVSGIMMGAALIIPIFRSVAAALFSDYRNRRRSVRAKRLGLVTLLHLLQPAARLYGRLKGGLTPWRRTSIHKQKRLGTTRLARWSETWSDPNFLLQQLTERCQLSGEIAWPGNDYESVDIIARKGLLGRATLKLLAEEHAKGRQYIRAKIRPVVTPRLILLITIMLCTALMSFVSGDTSLSIALAVATVVVALWALNDGTSATAILADAATSCGLKPTPLPSEPAIEAATESAPE